MASSTGYTCISCRVVFAGADLQRAHYKTDWHKYNLKRKVADLPPVTAENFQQRVPSQKAEMQEKPVELCPICKKHFTSKNSYDSHLRSRKHKEKAAAFDKKEGGTDTELTKNKKNSEELNQVVITDDLPEVPDSNKLADVSSESESEPEPLEITECLFCPHTSEDLESSLSHMSRVHGFFIPDLDYMMDIKGLMSHLCEKVGVGYMCIYCNERGKAFYSVEAVQQHMVDKCHCKMFFEGDAALEYAEFYDFSKSYPDHSHEESDEKALVLLADSSNLEVTDDLELVLPSGTKVGHRSLRHLYKQRPPSFEQRKSTLVGRLMAQYRALGWKGYMGEGATLRVRDEAWMKRMKQARDLRLGVKANKMQKHFRPQVVF